MTWPLCEVLTWQKKIEVKTLGKLTPPNFDPFLTRNDSKAGVHFQNGPRI